jgi:hypothetical protein
MTDKMIFVTQSVTQTSTTDLEGVGSLRWIGDKCYRWVKNNSGGALAIGELVCHDEALSDPADIFESVKDPTTARLMLLAGIVVADSVADGSYCWVQVLGYCESVILTNATNVTVTAGAFIKPVNSANYGTLDAATQPLYRRNLQTLEAYATHTTPSTAYKKCIVNCV